ncbi:MAG: HAMP domain-containing protein, partial [Desulfobacterales bacterium]
MFLEQLAEVRHTLAFRLTLWYAAIFTISAGVAFLFFYLLITTVMRERTDQDLLSEARTFSSVLATQGLNALKREAIIAAQAAGEKKIFFRLLYANRQVFSSSNMSYWRNIGISTAAIQGLLDDGRPVFDTIDVPEREHKIRILYAGIGTDIILQLGQSMENNARIIEAFQKIFVVTMAALFVFAVLIGWFMARRALAGVAAVTRTARRIADGTFADRVPVKQRQDEIDQLALTFNQMLDRIQTLVTGIREMSDNIAHDLKSPITRIRGLAEVTLTTGASQEEYEKMTASTIEECDRLLEMINTMLVISKTEAGAGKLHPAAIDIAAVVREACALFQSPAEDKGVTLTWETPQHCRLVGDIRLIQRMIANLLDNAIKYTPPQGTVQVTVQDGDGQPIRVAVKDSGIGISARDLPHIFERFYRCDPSRSEAGIGLGLSFARAIAKAHGGDI